MYASLLLGARTLLGAPGRTTRNNKLLGAPGITTRSKKLLGARMYAFLLSPKSGNKPYFHVKMRCPL